MKIKFSDLPLQDKNISFYIMRKALGTLIIFILSVFSSHSAEIAINGIYQGENLFVMNPFASTGIGFCVFEVTVNGQVTTDEINSSAFEIDLSVFKFEIGDKVAVIIKHKDGCTPKILNPEVLLSKSTFKVTEILVDNKNNLLKWTTTGEKGTLPYQVEQFKWKKWVNVGTVTGIGTSGTNSYSIEISAHSGLNKFRVKQIDFSEKPRYSPEATLRSLAAEVTFSAAKNDIKFSSITNYEIYDFYGRLVNKGRAQVVDITKYKKGDYFINYDNSMGQFTKK